MATISTKVRLMKETDAIDKASGARSRQYEVVRKDTGDVIGYVVEVWPNAKMDLKADGPNRKFEGIVLKNGKQVKVPGSTTRARSQAAVRQAFIAA